MKKYNLFSYLFALVALCINVSSSAVFISLEEWEHNENKQKVYLLSDWHGSSSQDQQDDLLWVAKQLDACVIAEDTDSYDGNNAILRTMRQYGTPTPPLGLIINKCRQNKIRCENVEYRYARTFLYPALKAHGSSQAFKKSWENVHGFEELKKDERDETRTIVRELKGYHYQDTRFQAVHSNLLAQTLREHTDYLIDTILQEEDPGNRYTMMDQNVKTCAKFIDLRMIRQLYRHRNVKHIFIPGGGKHIEVVSGQLPSLGFHRVNQVGEKSAMSIEGVFKARLYEKLSWIPFDFGGAPFDLGKYFNEHPQLHVPQSPVQKRKKECSDKLKGSLIMTGLLGLAGAIIYYNMGS